MTRFWGLKPDERLISFTPLRFDVNTLSHYSSQISLITPIDVFTF